MMVKHQSESFLQTGLVVWDQMKWGNDTTEGKKTSSTSLSGE